jgi:hypothetical protein
LIGGINLGREITLECIPIITLAINAITMVAVIAAAVIYGFQLHQMTRATDAATLSANTAKRALELCERADLQIVDLHLSPDSRADANAKLSVKYQNYGRTTAKNVRATIRFREMPAVSPSAVTPPAMVAPGAHNCFNMPLSAINNQLTASDYDRINNLAQELWFIITIEFFDVFDIHNGIVYEARFDTKVRGFGFTSQRIYDHKA